MAEALDAGAVLGCTWSCLEKDNKLPKRWGGLMMNHAYAIIDAFEVGLFIMVAPYSFHSKAAKQINAALYLKMMKFALKMMNVVFSMALDECCVFK